jgi:ubiquinone biosynthesis protein Coq4
MDVLLILLLTVLNGAFAMSEMALAASRKVRLMADAEAGDKGARAALALMEQPTQFLSSVQVGITSIGMLNGIVGEAAFAHGLGLWLQSLGLSSQRRARLLRERARRPFQDLADLQQRLQLPADLIASWIGRVSFTPAPAGPSLPQPGNRP